MNQYFDSQDEAEESLPTHLQYKGYTKYVEPIGWRITAEALEEMWQD